MNRPNVFFITMATLLFGGIPGHTQNRPAQSISSWTGCYVGGNIGGSWGKDKTIDFVTLNTSGFIGGGQVGCDYQFSSNWLIGIQGDFTGSAASSQQNYSLLAGFLTGNFQTQTDWFASVTGRLGYAAGPWLVYGKGGAAWIRDRLHDTGSIFLGGSFDNSGAVSRNGWTLGGGLEYAFAPNWSVFTEYDFYQFDTHAVTFGAGPGVVRFEQNFSLVKFGVNYRFGSK